AVPNVRIKGRTYNGDLGLVAGDSPIETLNGVDPGWSTIGATQGTMHIRKVGPWERFWAGWAGTAGVVGSSANARAHRAAQVNALGEPVLQIGEPASVPPAAPGTYQAVAVRTMPVIIGGRVQWIDPSDT